MSAFQVTPIGEANVNENGFFVQLEKRYIPALTALEGFSHINVLWWANGFDTPEAREVLTTPKPYQNAPETMGIFATRSPIRPNPIALTTARVLTIDYTAGLLQLEYLDTEDKTPVLDIKPYTPSNDRVEAPTTPAWCSNWPKSLETSGDFDWASVFAF